MALTPSTIRKATAVVEKISRRIWNLPTAFPTAGIHVLHEDLGLDVPSAWEDYRGASIRS
jgi:hypothetical protein